MFGRCWSRCFGLFSKSLIDFTLLKVIPRAISVFCEFVLGPGKIYAGSGREDIAMGIIGWIFFGLIVGIVAKFLTPGRDPGGFIVTALIGIAGALIGGFLGREMGLYQENDPVGFVMAVVGSIILLLLYRMVAGRRSLG
jgi:uncharacterized membrane protein YeaQ/YmgE (transglycosylase-associated protein family)